jgi:hypothetical protein
MCVTHLHPLPHVFCINIVVDLFLLQDMATRILAAWYLTGQDNNYTVTNFDAWDPNGAIALHINAQTNDTDELRPIPFIPRL